MFTKKSVLIFAFLMFIFFILVLLSDSTCNLGSRNFCALYSEEIRGISEMFIVSVVFFLFSLITYFMREEVYRAWFRFARWWIPLSMLIIFIAPEYSSDRIFPIEKAGFDILMSGLFVLVSALIIIFTSVRLRKK